VKYVKSWTFNVLGDRIQVLFENGTQQKDVVLTIAQLERFADEALNQALAAQGRTGGRS
jgi:hypothetical protein